MQYPRIIISSIIIFYSLLFLLYAKVTLNEANNRIEVFEKSFGSSLSFILSDAVNDAKLLKVDSLSLDFLKVFSLNNPQYSQVRILSDQGMELLRINHGDSLEVVPYENLQNKSARYYFQDLMKGEQTIYTSGLDFNVERGEIQQGVITLRVGRKYEEEKKVIFLNITDKYFRRFISDFKDIDIFFQNEYQESSLLSLIPFFHYPYVKSIHLDDVSRYLQKAGVAHRPLNFFIKLKIANYRLQILIGSVVTLATLVLTLWLYSKMLKNHNQGQFYTNLYRQFIDESFIFSMTDLRGRITYVNETFCNISGYSAMELLGKDHRIVNSGEHDKAFFKEMWNTIKEGRVFMGEICNRKKNGEYYWVSSVIGPLRGADGRIVGYAAVRYDITLQKRLRKELDLHEGQSSDLNP